MSLERVEVVRRIYELGLDPSALVAARDYLDPDFELHTPPMYPEGEQVYRGADGLARWAATVQDIWAEWRFEVEQLLDADERVLALIRIAAEGGASGVRLEREVAHVWTFTDDRAASVRVFFDRSEGLAEVGLAN